MTNETKRRAEPSAALPLGPVDLQILLVLSDGDVHGYGLMKAVEEQSGGKVRLEVGSLYRVIKRMLTGDLIEESAAEPGLGASGRGPKPRRFYKISDFGRAVAAAEVKRLAEVVETARVQALIDGEKA
ncbi:MAG: helix-turn-helix transcriptional regulator [Acidobacteria bacterium]|nr:helix-turn-helix transcriptional regulator [Acidobacteriota bacterium]